MRAYNGVGRMMDVYPRAEGVASTSPQGDDVSSWSVGGVSVKESTSDLLTVLSAAVEHAKGLLSEMKLTAEDSELLKLQVRIDRQT